MTGILSAVQDISRNRYSYVMLLPAFLYTVIYGYLTLPYLYAAFIKIDYQKSIFQSDFVWFRNFEFFFRSVSAVTITINTLRLNVLSILFGTVLSILIAILFNELVHRGFVKTTQAIMVFPTFISSVAISYFVYNLFSTRYGVVNNFLELLNLERVSWYTSPNPWVWIITGVRIWSSFGMSSVIYIAVITGINRELYEAAMIDGASRIRLIRHITLPGMLPTISILTLLAIGRVFYGDFGTIYAIIRDNGMLFPTTDIIETYVFRALRITGNTSLAMAVGLVQSIVGFALVLGSNFLVKHTYPEGSLF